MIRKKKCSHLFSTLEPYIVYDIWVKAYTLKYEGEPSGHIIRRTDIAGPSEPQILNLTCHSHDSVYIQWARPSVFWGSVDYYYINYRTETSKYFEEIELTAEKNHLESAVRDNSNKFFFFFFLFNNIRN